MKTITVTQARFKIIMRTLLEVGYSCLSEDEQRICDASDNGTLRFADPKPAKFAPIHQGGHPKCYSEF